MHTLGRDRPVTGEARYLRAFFAFLGLAFCTCGAGGIFSIRRSTSSGVNGDRFCMEVTFEG